MVQPAIAVPAKALSGKAWAQNSECDAAHTSVVTSPSSYNSVRVNGDKRRRDHREHEEHVAVKLKATNLE